MTDTGRTIYGGAGGGSLRIPDASEDVGVPLGLSVTKALDGESTALVWNRNDDTGVAFPGATEVAFAANTCTLNAAHNTLMPDTGWYKIETRLTFSSTGATVVNLTATGRSDDRIPLPTGTSSLRWTDVLPLYLESLQVIPVLRSGTACSVTGATMYVWRLDQ